MLKYDYFSFFNPARRHAQAGGTPEGFNLAFFLSSRRRQIIAAWAGRLRKGATGNYAAIPWDELRMAVSNAYDAQVDVILNGDFSRLNAFIYTMTKICFEAGFLLSDVQKAFEPFRQITMDFLLKETSLNEFADAAGRLNDCLSYTLHGCSDGFQSMHYKKMVEQNRRLVAELQASERALKNMEVCYNRRLKRTGNVDRIDAEQINDKSKRMACVGKIIGALFHEIRNPLCAVKMNLQIIKKNARLKGNDQRRIDISVQEVKRLEGLLEERLDFAKPLRLKKTRAQINTVLTETLELLEMKFAQAGLGIIADIDSELPVIEVDKEKMGQVFINILLNAIDASTFGRNIEVITRCDTVPANTVRIVITDEGQGVAEQHMSDIFKPFFTTKHRGAGLGLSNARRIIEAHGGRIEVENRKPSGLCVHILIPGK